MEDFEDFETANDSLSPRGDGPDQLSISFKGEIFVFDSVMPEKVQAVLLLLGGYEVPPSEVPNMALSSRNQRGSGDSVPHPTPPDRAASLSRFRKKRKELCFEKKIRYNARKEVALRMQRKKGQFVSSKVSSKELASTSASRNAIENSGQNVPQQETLCMHCGTSSKNTPMQCREPASPGTLCNACGLMWANKAEANGSDIGNNSTTPSVDPSCTRDNDNLAVNAEE